MASDCAQLDAGARVDVCRGFGNSWSCAFGRCVYECLGPRTCDSDRTDCITCGGSATCLATMNCVFMTHLEIERASCPVPSGLWPTRSTPMGCVKDLLFPDGGVAGVVYGYDRSVIRAEVPSLGGTCIGTELPTGATRFSLSCPDCTLMIRPEIVGP